MDIQFFWSLFKGIFLFSGNFIQSLLAYIGIVSFLYLLFPRLEGKLKDRLDIMRHHKLNILLIFLLASVIMTSYSLYHNRDLSLKLRITDWAWKSGASVQELDPTVNDFLGHPFSFALKMRYNNSPTIEVVRSKPSPDLLYFESPIDDPTTLSLIGSLSDETKDRLRGILEAELLRAGVFFELEDSPMYIYDVMPIEQLTQRNFIETVSLLRREGALIIMLTNQAK